MLHQSATFPTASQAANCEPVAPDDAHRRAADSAVAIDGVAPCRLSMFPADAKQAFRVRRYLMAASTALLVPVAFGIFWLFGMLPGQVVWACSAVVAAEIVAFYIFLRSGLNLRLADPSLTTELIVVSMVTLASFLYFVPAARSELDAFYLVILSFGLLRLGIRRMLVLALVAFVSHAAMLLTWHNDNPHAELWPSIAQLAVLALVLPWFAVMGGYVSNLRNQLKEMNNKLTSARDRIEQIAIRDTLTGIFNRRHLLEVLEHEISRAQRSQTPLAIALMDIDHFKRINDKLGHATGDEALRHFVAVAQTGMRIDDIFGRYGGEEFLLIMPNTGEAGAGPAAERIRVNVEKAKPPAQLQNYRFTVTAGVSILAAGEDAASLLERADRGLYRGKGAGRNRVMIVDPNPLRTARR